GRYRSLNLAPLAGIKPAPQVEPPVEPSGRSRQRASGDAEVLFVGPGLSRPTVVGPTRQPEPGPLAGIKPALQVEPPVEPGGRSGLPPRGAAEVLSVGAGPSRPTVVGPTRQPEPGPLAGIKPALQVEPPVEPGGRSRQRAPG